MLIRWVEVIRKARENDCLLVASHIYQMYLGLHSGAKILKRRYSLEGKTLEIDSSLKVDYSTVLRY